MIKQNSNRKAASSAYLVAWPMCHLVAAHQRSQTHYRSAVASTSSVEALIHYLWHRALRKTTDINIFKAVCSRAPTMGDDILTRLLAVSFGNLALITYDFMSHFVST